ncbi:MAG: ribonuclease J [Actinomycetota bacterium]|nr:ribonuclease J [Actinomycetota bacterium]
MNEKKKNTLRVIPLGGLGEIGKNMMVVEDEEGMILIDAGLKFPGEELLGIDIVLPDYSYVVKNQERLKGIIITHGHEDHTGALPYLLREVGARVYGTKLTLGLIKEKLKEYDIEADLFEISSDSTLKLGNFDLSFFSVCHSIPDGVGIIIGTSLGYIVHTGDFKLDQTPVDGRTTELDKLACLKDKDVLLLLSDSTNAEVPGYTSPEKMIGANLLKIFEEAENRIIVATFASHLHRIQQIFDAAKASGRRVAVSGRSIINNVKIASETGYLEIPSGSLVDIGEINNFHPSKMVVLCTGSQGEPLSALSRIAAKEHKRVKLADTDTVVVSASPIPGNERAITRIINQIFRYGADVYYEQISGVHASGHPAQEELKILMNLVKPRFFVPIHGEYRHLKHHADLAVSVGIPRENIFLCEDGDILELNEEGAGISGSIEVGEVFVDGLGVGDIGDVVLRDRQILSSDGIFIVLAAIDPASGETKIGPEVISRGFVYVKEAKELIDESIELVAEILEEARLEGVIDMSSINSVIKKRMMQFLYSKTKRRPMVVPFITEG